MTRKKILYIQHSGASGGAPMSLFYLLEFVKKKHDVVVYFITDGPAVEFYRKNGIECHIDTRLSKYLHCTIASQCLNPLSVKFYKDIRPYLSYYTTFLSSYVQMKSIIERENPDIVHLNSSVLLSEGLAAKRIGVPVVWHMRDFLEYGTFRIRHYVISEIIKRCSTCIVALCESEAERIGVTEKVSVIPNFVDLSKFNLEQAKPVGLRSTYGWEASTPVIAMLGWIIPGKGAKFAVEAMAEVLKRNPDAKLVLFGKGAPENDGVAGRYGYYRSLRKLISKMKIGSSVRFAGAVFNVADYIAEIDVVVAPFTVPHFARPILEAGAMRKVVVTSDLDGTREMVLNGEAGYLARPGDAGDLAARMIEALGNDNSERIERMYQNVVENYNAARNAERTMALYVDLP